MRPVTLNATQAGITRLREKGGASPNSLYELLNGYVDASKAPTQRPGTTFVYTLTPNTKGLCAFKDKLHVFASTPITLGNALFVSNCLRHPSPAFAGQIKDIHYSQPFLGYLYVVAQFDDDQICHYWLSEPPTWIAEHAYLSSDSVQPTTPNGYYYRASTELTPPAWAPGVKRAVGDVIQPTVANGFKYTCTAVSGAAPISGATEPKWPTIDAGTVTEYAEAAPPADPPQAPSDPSTDPNNGRYNNPGGGGGGGGRTGPGTHITPIRNN